MFDSIKTQVQSQPRVPLKHVWVSLIVPPVLLGILIFAYVILSGVASAGGQEIDDLVRGALPYILAVNHTLVLLMLLYLLHQNGRGLADIGWSVQDTGHLAREIGLGLIVGVGFYLFKEFVIDSLGAVIEGQRPTFYSLFNFSLADSDIPLLIAATTLVFIEESVYRGFAIPPLRDRYGLLWALILSSLFFGLLHWGNGLSAVGETSVFGLFFALVFLWRQNLVTGTVAHALYNLLLILT